MLPPSLPRRATHGSASYASQSGWTSGAPSRSAASGSSTGSSGSYSTRISRLASSAASGVSAATAATTSPSKRTTPRAKSVRSRTNGPYRTSGTSSCVSTARTPGSSRAAETSTLLIRACGSPASRSLPWASPGKARSARYLAAPVAFSRASCLVTRVPTTPGKAQLYDAAHVEFAREPAVRRVHRRDPQGQARGDRGRDGRRARPDEHESDRLRGARLRLRADRRPGAGRRADERSDALHRHLRAAGADPDREVRPRRHARRRRLRDERAVRRRDAHLRRLPREADRLLRPADRVRRVDHALDRDRGCRSREHPAGCDRDLPGGTPAPGRPRLRGRAAQRRCLRRDRSEHSAAAHGSRGPQCRARSGGNRRAARTRGVRALRRRAPPRLVRARVRARGADGAVGATTDPEWRLPGRGRDRRRRCLGSAAPDRRRGDRRRRLDSRRLHRLRTAGGRARQLLEGRTALGLQDGRARDHGSRRPLERRLLRAVLPDGPTPDRVQRGAAGADGLVLRGCRVRQRPLLEGARPRLSRAPRRRLVHEPLRLVHRRPRRGDGRAVRARGAERRRPWALAGGREGTNNYLEYVRGGEVRRCGRVARVALDEGDRVRSVTGTGGGFGDPREREPERVRADVLDGYVAPEDASQIYGVE